jgi:methyl-accepting chemotaxis protein-2 (aspartate sensor receptor)
MFALLQFPGGLLFSSLNHNQQSFAVPTIAHATVALTKTWERMLVNVSTSRSSARTMMDPNTNKVARKLNY